MKIIVFLKQLYPFPIQNWKTLAIISLSISACMLLLQPFGLSQLKINNKILFLSGYGLVTFAVLSINILFLVKLFSENKWNILKQILWSLWVVIILGLANYAYSSQFINSFKFRLTTILSFQVYTTFIAMVPITILILIRQNKLLKSNQSTAEVINYELSSLHEQTDIKSSLKFISDNGKITIKVNPIDLAYIECIGNYIYIYQRKDDRIEPIMLRSTISNAEKIIANEQSLVKCLRAFIVNLNFKEEVNGNAQGYRLKIKDSEHLVFVSRQYTKRLKKAIA